MSVWLIQMQAFVRANNTLKRTLSVGLVSRLNHHNFGHWVKGLLLSNLTSKALTFASVQQRHRLCLLKMHEVLEGCISCFSDLEWCSSASRQFLTFDFNFKEKWLESTCLQIYHLHGLWMQHNTLAVCSREELQFSESWVSINAFKYVSIWMPTNPECTPHSQQGASSPTNSCYTCLKVVTVMDLMLPHKYIYSAFSVWFNRCTP